jgi:hypothetical protein
VKEEGERKTDELSLGEKVEEEKLHALLANFPT